MAANASKWTGQTETEASVQDNMDSIDDMQDAISTLQAELSQKKKAARLLEKNMTMEADTIENKAIGFHTSTPEKLEDYDIKLRKPRENKPIPSENLAVEIKDDFDGEGFILSTTVDPVADKYEWEKGAAGDPLDLNTIPKMLLFKVTSKTTFVDDEITPGVRYFYRVRGCNTSGEGNWSGPVSRVQ